ncbi:MAG: MerR family transcriptional regulator [Bacteroidota bacterium]
MRLENYLNLPLNEYFEKIKSDEANDALKREYDPFVAPILRSGQTGVSKRDISVWGKEGLLPFEFTETGWFYYSIADSIWLRLVGELKKLRIGNETIKKYKNQLFPKTADQLIESFEIIIDNPYLPKEIEAFFNNEKIEVIKANKESVFDLFKELKVSFFGVMVMIIIKFRLNYAAVINADADILFINLGKPYKDEYAINLSKLMKSIDVSTVSLIDIYKLCKDFFNQEDLKIGAEYYLAMLSEEEKRAIDEIRTGKYKQVTIELEGSDMTHLRLTKSKEQNDAMIKKLSWNFKSNDYKRIELTTVDGKIVNLLETDVIKLG